MKGHAVIAIAILLACATLGVQAFIKVKASDAIIASETANSTVTSLSDNYTSNGYLHTETIHGVQLSQFENVKETSDSKIVTYNDNASITSEFIETSDFTQKKALTLVKNYISDTERLIRLFREDDEELGLHTMTYKNSDSTQYTGIIKYNGDFDGNPYPVVIICIVDILEDGYIETIIDNSSISWYNRDAMRATYEDVCNAYDVQYTAKDLMFITDIESNTLFSIGYETDSTLYTDDKFFVFDTETGTITQFRGDINNAPTVVIIPPTISGVEVKAIGEKAFYKYWGSNSVKSVVIPDSVTVIGEKAFLSNTLLETVVLPANLKKIGADAFRGCSALKEVEITGTVTEIPANAFKDCDNLKTVTLCGSETLIGKNAFSGCSSLENVYNTSSLNIISDGAFNGTRISNDYFTTVSQISDTAF